MFEAEGETVDVESGLLKKLKSEALDLRAREDWGEKAVEANTRILKVDSCNKAALNRRARCYRELGDFSAAERDYRRALELDSENTNIQNALKTIEEEARKQRGRRVCREDTHHQKFRQSLRDSQIAQRQILI
ncbi:MAG: tetratricopeptide repeat protein [Rubrobacter sp.]|nr:tetratricopeptide repeat protein [Rubrobacter sp.]